MATFKFRVLIKGTYEQAQAAMTQHGVTRHGAASTTVENPETRTTVRASWETLHGWYAEDFHGVTPPYPAGSLLHFSYVPPIPWENVNGELRAKFTRDGFDVTLRVTVDTDADVSWAEDDPARMRGLRDGSWTLYVIDVRVYKLGVIELAGDCLSGVELHPPFSGPGWAMEDKFEENASDVVDDTGMIESSIAAARDILAKLCENAQ